MVNTKKFLVQKLLISGAALVVFGCEGTQFGAREKGALGGAALGAGLGAIVGSQSGNAGAGVAIGAGAGALAGGLIGNSVDGQQREADEQDEMLRRQQAELERQRREIEDLRRQQYQDDRQRGYDSSFGSGRSDSIQSNGGYVGDGSGSDRSGDPYGDDFRR